MPDDAPSRDGEALRSFLAERDAPCPGCGYNLRGLQGGACPECGQRVLLQVTSYVEVVRPPTGHEYGIYLRWTIHGILVVLFVLAIATWIWPRALYWPVMYAVIVSPVVGFVFWMASGLARRHPAGAPGEAATRIHRRAHSISRLRVLAIFACLAFLTEGVVIVLSNYEWIVHGLLPTLWRQRPWSLSVLRKIVWCVSGVAVIGFILGGLLALAMLATAGDERARANAVRFALRLFGLAWIVHAVCWIGFGLAAA